MLAGGGLAQLSHGAMSELDGSIFSSSYGEQGRHEVRGSISERGQVVCGPDSLTYQNRKRSESPPVSSAWAPDWSWTRTIPTPFDPTNSQFVCLL